MLSWRLRSTKLFTSRASQTRATLNTIVCLDVIPAEAGIHLCFSPKIKMDSRFRGNDGTL